MTCPILQDTCRYFILHRLLTSRDLNTRPESLKLSFHLQCLKAPKKHISYSHDETNTTLIIQYPYNLHNGLRVESSRTHVCQTLPTHATTVPPLPQILTLVAFSCRYNRYLAVASRVVRRSLKEDKRIQAERRGEMEMRFAKWEVRRNTNCKMSCVPRAARTRGYT